ncbi:MAG: hypothetical protein R6U51_01580 [Anaerolineales bacterium]
MKWTISFLLLTFLITSCVSQPTLDERDVIATIVAATLNAPTSEKTSPPATQAPSNETYAPSPSSTPLPSSPTSTPTNTPSLTPTPTNTPSTTPTPTSAPGDPRETLGTPSWEDNFSSSANWYTYQDNSSKMEVKGEKLILKVFQAENYEYWGLSVPELEDFYLEYTGAFGESCSGKDRFGMIFRSPKENKGYLFGITCDGHLRLSAWDGEDYTTLQNWQKSEHIQTGPGAENRVGIKAKGTTLTGYINGHEVVSKKSDLFEKGRFGAMFAAAETPGFQVEITNAAYWTLK